MSLRGMVYRRKVVLALTLVVLASAGAVSRALRRDEVPQLDWRSEVRALQPRIDGERLVQSLSDGGRAELTLDPALQGAAEQLLRAADAVRGAAVVVDVADGRLLALAGRTRTAPAVNDLSLPLGVWAPAASVFKLVTTAALLDAGVRPDTRVCYHGGTHSVELDNLSYQRRLDGQCGNLSFGLAKSQNAIIGRLAYEHLAPARLMAMAEALGFNRPPSFELPAATSTLTLPAEPLAFARTAAGFWQSMLSPLSGALLAATIARGGRTLPLHVVARVFDGGGREHAVPMAEDARVLDEETAHTLGRMMVNTTEWGSAQRAFHDARHRRLLGRIRVAGKTGTLSGRDPGAAYSWFVGFAPADQPRIAFSVLLARADAGDVRAAEVARALVAAWIDRGARDGGGPENAGDGAAVASR
jgi:cell division protein FtsI/penicillin-binding protein 2